MNRSVDQKPYGGEMLKPFELIEVKGIGPLTLADRTIYNLLVENAWGPKLAEVGHFFEISTSALKSETASNRRLVETIERLMRTIVIAKRPDGSELRLQLLSTNDFQLSANTGKFVYSFPAKMAELLKDSQIFAKLDLTVMKSFSSKYAFSLYEALSKRIRLRHVFVEEFSVDAFRDLLGVEDGKLQPYKNLKTYAIDPAIMEVNAIAPYNVSVEPKKEGRKVVALVMGWGPKTEDEMKEAYKELGRPHFGRKQRLLGKVDRTI